VEIPEWAWGRGRGRGTLLPWSDVTAASARTDSSLAGIPCRASVSVVTNGTGERLGRALPCGGVAHADMALVGGWTAGRIGSAAYAIRADVRLRARVAIAAGGGVVGIHASRCRVAAIVGAHVAVVATRGWPTYAGSAGASVIRRARVAIVARRRVVGVHTS
jgi:hypothetical protein